MTQTSRWNSYSDTFFKDPVRKGQLGLLGGSAIRRGLIGFELPVPLYCFEFFAHSCYDWAHHESTCHYQQNTVNAGVVHEVLIGDNVVTEPNSDSDSCTPPPCPPADDDDEEEWEYLRAEAPHPMGFLDPTDPVSVAELEKPVVAFTCGGGDDPGGGQDCWDEYWVYEISYDGGNTWEVLWEGWVEVCEYAE